MRNCIKNFYNNIKKLLILLKDNNNNIFNFSFKKKTLYLNRK